MSRCVHNYYCSVCFVLGRIYLVWSGRSFLAQCVSAQRKARVANKNLIFIQCVQWLYIDSVSDSMVCLSVNHAWFGLPVQVLSSAQLSSLRFASVTSLAKMSSASLHVRTWSEIHGRKNFVYSLKCFFPY